MIFAIPNVDTRSTHWVHSAVAKPIRAVGMIESPDSVVAASLYCTARGAVIGAGRKPIITVRVIKDRNLRAEIIAGSVDTCISIRVDGTCT